MLCALIMAGGKGTRFWPMSTEERPKQFLSLISDDTMLQMTVKRILPIIPMERIFICTGKQYEGIVKEQIPDLPSRNIIIEPEGRNTAPCIALSALVIKRYYTGANMIVLPSDHLIGDEFAFREIVIKSDSFIEKNKDCIVTLGIKPDRAEIGYGYIKKGSEYEGDNGIGKVELFVEKPDINTATKYVSDGCYLWNAGMFMWTIDGILSMIKKYLPNTYEALINVEDIPQNLLQNEIDEKYKYTDSISIDYGVLEKAEKIFVIPTEIGWDDIGSWGALERYREKDKNGNIILGDAISINSSNNIIISNDKKIVISEIDNIYVLENKDRIFIGKKNDIDRLKSIKEGVDLENEKNTITKYRS
ncbi:mannose-1-phosphate guanylyltransferase [Clostridium sp. LP20]|uniref:mannose-1-phosphate guanylyltransferase n=1 Tax=Clostridium sp. LP20 TaxID=3418665 RepID=UPI003EE7BC45